MKKKLIRIANQIYSLEQKIQNNQNVLENMQKMEELADRLSQDELWEVNKYLEEKISKQPLWQQIKFLL